MKGLYVIKQEEEDMSSTTGEVYVQCFKSTHGDRKGDYKLELTEYESSAQTFLYYISAFKKCSLINKSTGYYKYKVVKI